MPATITEIRRHPVKSLGGEAVAEGMLAPGGGIAHDRRYALVPAQDGAPPPVGWRPKSRCVVLVRHAELARVAARFDEARGTLTLHDPGKAPQTGRPEVEAERAALEAVLNAAFADAVQMKLALAAAGEGAMIGDVEGPLISLLNLNSLAALEGLLAQPLDPRRFRANLHVAGLPAWVERGWVGKRLRVGAAELEVVAPIERCAATEVNPDTTARDATVLRGLVRGFGHTEMGVYAKVVAPGRIAPGATILA
ncbi:MAG: MOSC domain-containing protein [Rhodospirillaceae bacterium]|nr:MOSC domain-containing protein [Rhodospirillaceae bacterium]